VRFLVLLALLALIVPSGCVKKISVAPIAKSESGVWVCQRDFGCHASQPLEDLLLLLEIKHDHGLASIVAQTQRAWLRPAGSERWHLEDSFASKKAQIEPLLVQMGLVAPVFAENKTYDYGVILGSLVPSMRERARFLIDEWNKGVRFKQLVFLGGQRELDPSQESLAGAKTETDAMKIIYAQTNWPKAMKKLPVLFVDAPAKPRAGQKPARPNTGDTIYAWLKEGVKPGSVLAVSSQPFVHYQDAVLRTILPSAFRVQTIGPRAKTELSMAIHLDNLARLLYQEERFILKTEP
jgi:hypothetical protein